MYGNRGSKVIDGLGSGSQVCINGMGVQDVEINEGKEVLFQADHVVSEFVMGNGKQRWPKQHGSVTRCAHQ